MGEHRIQFVSPTSLSLLDFDEARANLVSESTGEIFPVINHIPRFVSAENYAAAFGLQWNTFRKTQLDSFTGIPISAERLKRIAGGELDIFRGRNVLEAGCGAGRFTEIMLAAGANVWAVDLSTAVDANYENCHNKPGYTVCQADILSLPFSAEQFDIVVSIGVIQHTPDPEKTIQALCSQVKPGSLLLIDHYGPNYPTPFSRKMIRKYLLTKDEAYAMLFVQRMVDLLWPIHRALSKIRSRKGLERIWRLFIRLSPVVDYQEAYPTLGDELLYQWAILDTYDTLTDRFKYLRSKEDLQIALEKNGMIDIQASYGGNGIEVKALKRG